MIQHLCDPLEEYKAEYKEKFRDTVERTFDEFTRLSAVNVEENGSTCAKIYDLRDQAKGYNKKLTRLKVLRGFLWALSAAGLCIGVVGSSKIEVLVIGLLITALSVIFIFTMVNPEIHRLTSTCQDTEQLIEKATQEAWHQMARLNSFYDWGLIPRMIQKTVPWMQFDTYCTDSRVAQLVREYGWDESFHDDKSVVYIHSGDICGNPFALMRTRQQIWTEKTYEGTRHVSWQTIERDSNGRRTTIHHSETLRATVTAPFPEYVEETRLIYGNGAAPDLKFTREKNARDYTKKGFLGLFGNSRTRHLNKLARDMKRDFVKMSNDDFELSFYTPDRNHSQQYMLLFTPLAQQSMLSLLRDKTEGYGDDFTFVKDGKMNVIISDHTQEHALDLDPQQFIDFDYAKAKERFLRTTQDVFRSVYFAFAPLMTVPEYRQHKGRSAIYGSRSHSISSVLEHESIANHFGSSAFSHPQCDTECILKTHSTMRQGGQQTISVVASGFQAVARVTYKSVWCSNGRYYDVPVEWNEYLPIQGRGTFVVDENMPDLRGMSTSEQVSTLSKAKDRLPHGCIYRRGLMVHLKGGKKA